ncbi:MAG: flagellar hook-associated protein FlgL [Desulfobulbus sp.]|nr:flagellar hook-associated protein FlgL [Desulfobulbus sp.]
MRVSTSQIFNSATIGMQNRQYDLYKLQNQMSTGRRVLTPADDPIAASQALLITQSQGLNAQFTKNIGDANSKLNLLDSTLSGINDELQAIYEKAVDAGNASYSPEQRGAIAVELKQRLENLIGLGNTKDGTGLYIFSGYKTSTQPFQVDAGATPPYALGSGTYVQYKGDGGVESLQVSPSKTVDTSANGLDVFMQVRDGNGNPTGRSIFDSVKNMVDLLDPTSGIPFNSASYGQALDDTAAMISHISTLRSSVGGRMQGLDNLANTASEKDYQYQSRLSDLQDLDWIDAYSRFSQLQLQLQATQLAFRQTSQLSLFSIL